MRDHRQDPEGKLPSRQKRQEHYYCKNLVQKNLVKKVVDAFQDGSGRKRSDCVCSPRELVPVLPQANLASYLKKAILAYPRRINVSFTTHEPNS